MGGMDSLHRIEVPSLRIDNLRPPRTRPIDLTPENARFEWIWQRNIASDRRIAVSRAFRTSEQRQ
jgi:hypothetical protein